MPEILMMVAVGVLFLWLMGRFTQGNPAKIASVGRKAFGIVLLAAAAFIALRGSLIAAVPLVVLALSLFGKTLPFGAGTFGWDRKASGQKSSVRTRALAMELDHDTSVMDGRVLDGPYRDRQLSSMSRDELLDLLKQFRGYKDQSASLLEAYLDRTYGNWRAAAGAGEASRPASSSAMTKDEAYLVLGLKPGATQSDIRSAHRRLMKQFHPDHGGSDYIAAKINQAKDLLLG
jgi:hypothetical protein